MPDKYGRSAPRGLLPRFLSGAIHRAHHGEAERVSILELPIAGVLDAGDSRLRVSRQGITRGVLQGGGDLQLAIARLRVDVDKAGTLHIRRQELYHMASNPCTVTHPSFQWSLPIS